MKVSVIITSFNLSNFIEECVYSVVNQTYRPFEIIIADDCSSDNTIDLALKICKDIIVVRQSKNSGALLNSLAGLNKASGDIVSFIDGDDTWPLQKLDRVVKEFNRDPNVYFVTHNHRRVNSQGRPLGVMDETHRNLRRLAYYINEEKRQEFLRQSVLLRKGIWFGSAYSMRRKSIPLEFFNNIVKDNPNAKFAYLDLVIAPFVVQVNLNGKIVYVDDLVFDYRIHTTNSAHSNTYEKQLMALKRGRSTNLITQDVLSKTNSPAFVLNAYDMHLREYDYLEALYSGKKIRALILFKELLVHFINRDIILKETARLFSVFLMGSNLFLKIK